MQKNLFRIFVVGFSVFLVFSSQAKAQNADIVLDSSNGTSAFQIKNSNLTTVASFDSTGKASFRNGLKVHHSSTFNIEPNGNEEFTIANGNKGNIFRYDSYNDKLYFDENNNGTMIGIGTSIPQTKFQVDDSSHYARLAWYPEKSAFRVGYASNDLYWDNNNLGLRSTALGGWNLATGQDSLAIGNYASATNTNAVAIGSIISAEGVNSFILGRGANFGSGLFKNTISDSLMIGFGGTNPILFVSGEAVSGNVGIGTTDPIFKLSLDNDGGIMAKGLYGSGKDLSLAGSGSMLIWYPKKAAFRAGYTTGEWDDDNIGNASVAMGFRTKAKGEGSIALGLNASAEGNYSMALGEGTYSKGDWSFAAGQNTKAIGSWSFATGQNTTAEGSRSVTIGSNVKTTGNNSLAVGYNTSNTAHNSIAVGYESTSTIKDPDILLNPSGDSYLNADTGSVGIGTRSPSSNYKLHVEGSAFINKIYTPEIKYSSDSLASLQFEDDIIRFNENALVVVDSGQIKLSNITDSSSGSPVIIGSDKVLYKEVSSKRYKKDINNYTFDKNKIDRLRPVKFKWKKKSASNNKEDFGLIAEDVYKVFPELVVLANDKPESVRYDKLSVILLSVVQKQKDEIKELNMKNKELEDKYQNLEKRLQKLEGEMGK